MSLPGQTGFGLSVADFRQSLAGGDHLYPPSPPDFRKVFKTGGLEAKYSFHWGE
jgi:hypothetical protein